MATVTATFAHSLARAAGYEVTAKGEVLSGSTVIWRLGISGNERVSDDSYFGLIDWISRHHKDRAGLVFAYGDAITMDALGALGLAIKTAPTLRDSLVRVQRYFRLATDTVRYHLDDADGMARLRIEPCTEAHPAADFRNECALAGFASNIRRFGGDGISFARVTFRHGCPSDELPRYAAYFGCPVAFQAGEDAIAFCSDSLDLPNRVGDAAVSDFLTAHLDDQLRALGDEPTLSARLLRHLLSGLSAGVPPAADAALALGMSERTLYRRLSAEGQTYQGVLRMARQELAKELLAGDGCSISEVAFLTGFSEQSTFSRAFKRWVGESPARYRKQAAIA